MLVDLLSEDLAAWPDDAWIVIDDYHHIGESATAEAFVEGIVQHSPVQVLISTRDRPRWVSTRSVLYGEVLEIGQSMLAMSEDEVEELLAGGRDGMSSGSARARGRLAGGDRSREPDHVRISAAGRGPRTAGAALRVLRGGGLSGLEPESESAWPARDRAEPRPGLAAELLGAERAERVCAEALTLGVLEERGGTP